MSKDILNVAGKQIKRGENTIIDMQIARLPSGTDIDLPIYVFRSKKPGPVLLLSAGLHGDEMNGLEIVRRLIFGRVLENLEAGSVIAIPVMNIFGFLNFSREVPDGKDVNRSFPGNKKGSLASLVAYNLTHMVLNEVDYGIDFHTGGASRYNYPQVRYTAMDQRSAALAQAFNAPVRLISRVIDKSIRKQCFLFNIPLIVYEGGETLRFDESVIEQGVMGARKVMDYLGILSYKEEEEEQHSIFCPSSTWVRSKKAGMFTSYVRAGMIVKEKQILGRISDPFGYFESRIKSPSAGIVIGHNNTSVVHKGDALYHIGRIGE